MKKTKITQILLTIVSLLSFLGSHLLTILRDDIETKVFFGGFVNLILFVDVLLLIALINPFIIITLICLERD